MDLFFFIPKKIAGSHSRFNEKIDVVERFGKKELYVNGIQQSGSYTKRLWKKGLTDLLQKPTGIVKNILILGVGGGTLFPLLHKSFPDATVTAVDVDEEIISLYKKYFSDNNTSYLRLVCSDARNFLTREKKKFDIIIIDIYTGNDVPGFVTDTKFLNSCHERLAPRGNVIINYFSYKNQLSKSKRLLDRLSKIYQAVIKKRILYNIFYYCS